MVFRATNTESSGRNAKYTASGTRPTKTVDDDYPTKRRAATSSSSSASSSPSSGPASESAYELRLLPPSKNIASQDYLYYNADAPVEYYEMELDGASRAGSPPRARPPPPTTASRLRRTPSRAMPMGSTRLWRARSGRRWRRPST